MGIGWSKLPRSPVGMSRQELSGVLRATYTDASLTTGEISAHFQEIYSASVSRETIGRITDKVLDEMTD